MKKDAKNRKQFLQLKKSYVRIFPFAVVFALPFLGPLVESYIKQKVGSFGEDAETIKAAVAEKCIGWFEDILQYHRNPKSVLLDDCDD
ncbi:unnamed protein product [Gongylonema pulchrum]|uniref:LETM1 domain-containing protein n=1 Tax=Gongylonema pulchrum TaxID=637853 RepID=A0A183EZN2_9BILA|nr:unnamed protein product [Gongylonema pulchrum]